MLKKLPRDVRPVQRACGQARAVRHKESVRRAERRAGAVIAEDTAASGVSRSRQALRGG